MKTRLLATLFATAMLGGCATYDYTSGSAPGGYYQGRPSVEYYGPYGGGYGYGSGYGYSSYGYGAYLYGGYYGGFRPYGYYPYHRSHYQPYYRPYYPAPPRHPRGGHHGRGDHDDRNSRRGDRPPPWRAPDGRRLESGQVMIPPNARGAPPVSGQPARPVGRNPQGVPQLGQGSPAPPRQDAPAQAPSRDSSPWRQPAQSPSRPSPSPRAGRGDRRDQQEE